MNKQSNIYTVIYIIVLVVVVGSALALTSLSLRDRQSANAADDTMTQILRSVHITPAKGKVAADFDKYITGQLIVNSAGEITAETGAFDVNVAEQLKLPVDARQLPVYVCSMPDGTVKYILPVYGAGLWGPIWGYIALDSDGSTVYGAYFDHQSETPGLGAEIAKPEFSGRFEGKSLFHSDDFLPIAVVKAGQKPTGEEDYVDGISGGTVTSKGVGAMLDNCLTPYAAYLQSLRSK